MKTVKFATACTVTLLLAACASPQQALYEKADQGDAQSQLRLGLNLFHGENGFEQDRQKSLVYLEKSSAQGNAEAAFNLGAIHAKEKDYASALSYYQTACDNDYLNACDNLALLYKDGNGTAKNLHKAEQIVLQAIEKGSLYSHRIAATIYLEDHQPKKAIAHFKHLIMAPTTKQNPAYYKAYAATDVMEAYLTLKDQRNAYLWGSVAMLAAGFDAPIESIQKRFDDYQMLSKTLNTKTKHALAEQIIAEHFNGFQSSKRYFQTEQLPAIKPGVIDPDREHTINFVGYFITPNRMLFSTINALEKRDDAPSKIQLAMKKLDLSNKHMQYGAMYLQTAAAKLTTKQAIEVMNSISDKRLDYYKTLANRKLDVMNDIYDYQIATIKAHKPAEGA